MARKTIKIFEVVIDHQYEASESKQILNMDVSGEEESNSDSKFLALANELIEYIFNLDILDHRDICHLSQACHRFHVIANSNEVWRAKATQR